MEIKNIILDGYIQMSEYTGYSENRGLVDCPECEHTFWTSIPDNGDVVDCPYCGKKFEWIDKVDNSEV